jgi:regulatory protein
MDDNTEKKDLLQRAQRICSGREYCTGDIMALLERWGAKDEKDKADIIARLKEEKFIDDTRYCRAYSLDHFRQNEWGKVRISMMLKAKRLSDSDISSGLGAIDQEEYVELLKKLLDSQRKKIKAKNKFDLKGRLLRYALGKGFESHLVYEVLNSRFSD